MWNSLTRLTSSNPLKAISTTSHRGSNKATGLADFIRDWEQLKAYLGQETSSDGTPQKGQASSTPLKSYGPAVHAQLGRLLDALIDDAHYKTSRSVLTPCLEYVLKNQVLESLVNTSCSDTPAGLRKEVVSWFGQLVEKGDAGILVHGGVHRPLIKLLRACVAEDGALTVHEELCLAKTMSCICWRIRHSPDLLSIFLHERYIDFSDDRDGLSSELKADSDTQSSPKESTFSIDGFCQPLSPGSPPRRRKSEHEFLLFNFLLQFLHRDGDVGRLARNGILHLVELVVPAPEGYTSEALETAATWLADTEHSHVISSVTPSRIKLVLAECLLGSDFADVLAAGLGAMYGSLPGRLVIRPGTDTSNTQSTSIEDSISGEDFRNIAIGGLGQTGLEEDAELTARRRRDDDTRLKVMGVGITGTADFRDSLDAWLKLVEFIRDLLEMLSGSTAMKANRPTVSYSLENDSHQQNNVVSALASSILSSIQSLFLRNVLYPSILECSEKDGSAVAVLTYLDAMLDIIPEDSRFASSLLDFLILDDDGRDAQMLKDVATGSPIWPAIVPRRRRSSGLTSLALIENMSAHKRNGQDYFSSLGRFNLKDFMLQNIQSNSESTAVATLNLLGTLLNRHDRYSLNLLDVINDEDSTSFPILIQIEEHEVDVAQVGASLMYSSNSTSEAEPLVTESRSREMAQAPFSASSHISRNMEIVDLLLSLVSNSSYLSDLSDSPNVPSSGDARSIEFSNYLKDAEQTMGRNLSFRRGLLRSSTFKSDAEDQSPPVRRPSTLFRSGSRRRARQTEFVQEMYRHQLSPKADLPSLILDSFRHFFSHSPLHNIALTAVCSSLALCPYRALHPWATPPNGWLTAIDKPGTSGTSYEKEDGEREKSNFNWEDPSRLQQTQKRPNISNSAKENDNDLVQAPGKCLFTIMYALCDSVKEYCATIPRFDEYLRERRDGHRFAENLADALDLKDDMHPNQTRQPSADKNVADQHLSKREASINEATGSHPDASSLPISETRKSSFVPDLFSTPPRKTTKIREEIDDSGRRPQLVASPNMRDSGNTSSPFAVHYQQTASIKVVPLVVGATDRDNLSRPDSIQEYPGLQWPDTPTKASLNAHSKAPASPSTASDLSAAAGLEPQRVSAVTLSAILDNVVILEEFIKEFAAIISVRTRLGIDGISFAN